MPNSASSPFATLEAAFRLLVAEPRPLCLDGRAIGGGLPARPIPLDELRAMLLHPSVSFQTRDAALTELVGRAQHHGGGHGGAATVGLAGVLLPGLHRAVSPLTRACPRRADDLEAEALAALVEAIGGFPVGRDRVAARLLWPAIRAAHLWVPETSPMTLTCGFADSRR
jgi:hypothetical protein